MKLLLDEGVPLRTAARLRDAGHAAEHVLEAGLRGASDETILTRARDQGAVVMTRDSDFHMLLAMSGADKPSVVRLRVEQMDYVAMAELIARIAATAGDQLAAGVAVSARPHELRMRRLPIQTDQPR